MSVSLKTKPAIETQIVLQQNRPDSGHEATTAACPGCADIVEKVFFG